MTILEIAEFLELNPNILFDGNYRNRRGRVGYFAQIRCARHWIRISVSDVGSAEGRLSLADLNSMTKEILICQRPFIFPLSSIAAALKRIALSGTEWNPYHNAQFVPGGWFESKDNGHWFMVSASNLDDISSLAARDLERATDEFLSQMRAFDRTIIPVTRSHKLGTKRGFTVKF